MGIVSDSVIQIHAALRLDCIDSRMFASIMGPLIHHLNSFGHDWTSKCATHFGISRETVRNMADYNHPISDKMKRKVLIFWWNILNSDVYRRFR